MEGEEMDYNINEDKDIINNMINMINTALCYIYIYWYYSKFLSISHQKEKQYIFPVSLHEMRYIHQIYCDNHFIILC